MHSKWEHLGKGILQGSKLFLMNAVLLLFSIRHCFRKVILDTKEQGHRGDTICQTNIENSKSVKRWKISRIQVSTTHLQFPLSSNKKHGVCLFDWNGMMFWFSGTVGYVFSCKYMSSLSDLGISAFLLLSFSFIYLLYNTFTLFQCFCDSQYWRMKWGLNKYYD